MRNFICKTACIVSFCALISPISAAAAQSPSNCAVTITTLGAENPAFIVSNPFYGLTDLFRGIRENFTSGKMTKFSVRADVMNRKAAELLKMRQVAPDNAKLIGRAIGEYQLAVYQYALSAAQITSDDIAVNASADSVIDSITSLSMLHLRLIDDFLAASTNNANQAVLIDVRDRLADATARLFADTFGLTSLELRLDSLPSSDCELASVRNAEMFALLAKRAAHSGNEEATKGFLSFRSELLNRSIALLAPAPVAASAMFAAKAAPAQNQAVSATGFSELRELVGGRSERVQTLAYLLSTPELIANSELTSLRNGLLLEVLAR